MTPNNFPATEFMKDVVAHRMGKLSVKVIRERWKAGAYKGCPVELARFELGGTGT